MRFTLRRPGGLSWTARTIVAAVLVTGSSAAAVGVAASAQAQVRPATSGSSATVVNEAWPPSPEAAVYRVPGRARTVS